MSLYTRERVAFPAAKQRTRPALSSSPRVGLSANHSPNTAQAVGPVLLNARAHVRHSPVNLANLNLCLAKYPNRKAALELQSGFEAGFRIGFSGVRKARESRNQKSVMDNKRVACEKIRKEIKLNRVAGPFEAPPMADLHCSPLGLVPKKQVIGEQLEYRLIHNLSYPKGESVNDNISHELCTVKYARFDSAVVLMQAAGINCDLAKSDIKSAFRLLPVHPLDYSLLGFKCEGKYYYDRALPMGCSISCNKWEMFSTFIEWYLKSRVAEGNAMHYLDDFLFVGADGSNECANLLSDFHTVCSILGVPIANEKTEGPVKKLVFLGLLLDSEKQTVEVPRDKLQELREKINKALSQKKIQLKALQSLIGSLNFVCRAVGPGRPFLRRLICSTKGLKQPLHVTRVTAAMKDDLHMWLKFLDRFNGVSLFREVAWTSNGDYEFYTDAAASIGLGIYVKGKWAQARWNGRFKNETSNNNITFLELFPIVAAVNMFGDIIRNKRVLFHCDNAAVCEIISSQTSKCDRVMDLVRPLVLDCLRLNVIIKARHIRGLDNKLADSLSRFQMQTFHQAAPQADALPTTIPDYLWQL